MITKWTQSSNTLRENIVETNATLWLNIYMCDVYTVLVNTSSKVRCQAWKSFWKYTGKAHILSNGAARGNHKMHVNNMVQAYILSCCSKLKGVYFYELRQLCCIWERFSFVILSYNSLENHSLCTESMLTNR